jgi:hypothetical protein
MRKSILLSVIFLLLISGGAFAVTYEATGNPGDTLAGTPITLESSNNTFNYKNSGQDRPTVEGGTHRITTGIEMGFSAPQSPDGVYYLPATPGSTYTWDIEITNEGNADLTTLTTLSAFSNSPSGSGWTGELSLEGTNYGTSALVTIEEDTAVHCQLLLTPATTETGAPDASTGTINFTLTTGYGDAGTSGAGGYSYDGLNNLTYGGKGYISATNYGLTIEAPVMTITRTSTVDAPEKFLGDGGGVHASVPGSLWTFTISYTNEGTGNAEEVVIVDKVPDKCAAYKFNVQEGEDRVNVTAPVETSTGWVAYYSTNDNPFTNYGALGWNYVGPLTGTDTELEIDSSAKWVKWQRETASMEPGENATLQWSVYVK